MSEAGPRRIEREGGIAFLTLDRPESGNAIGVPEGTRNRLLSSFGATLETQMELESRAIAEASRGRENRERVRAFLEKRKPDFVANHPTRNELR
jgi:enoyl-CoA hydratase/carnithine racemase